ncbi:MAG: VOC family protein [Acidimicrobiaceae bacterium]|nr:VOC family protein [Acidimicrobiaceae bacterium]MBT5580808.1 VOC family protein [Acidimicrobiaceae bacterium]MBT5850969.1 VOC family protein [Acidimicrobiaceae bacterium]
MKNVRTVALFSIVVDDYDRAIRHYCQDLGFELVTDIDQGRKRFVIIRPAGAPNGAAGIVLAEASDDNQRSRIGNQTGGRVGFFLHTNNFGSDHAAMAKAGVRFHEEPRQEPYGTVAVFEDAYGNLWDLLEPSDGIAGA